MSAGVQIPFTNHDSFRFGRGVISVSEYKLYCLDQRGRISRRHELEAADDDAAIAQARAQFSGMDCELWSGIRKVALLPAQGEPVLADRGA